MWTALPNGSKIAATSRSTSLRWCQTLVIGTEMNSANAPGRLTPMPWVSLHKMPPAGEAVAAAAAHHVALRADDFAREKIFHVRADFSDFADKLVPDHHGRGNRLLRPFVPLVDVHVGAADAGAIHVDEHVVDADLGLGNVLEPKPWFAFLLDECFHIKRTGGVRFSENPSSNRHLLIPVCKNNFHYTGNDVSDGCCGPMRLDRSCARCRSRMRSFSRLR